MYKVPGTGIGVGTGVGALAVTGADDGAATLARACREAGIAPALVGDAARPTTTKVRVVTERNQQVARVDYEMDSEISGDVEQRVVSAVHQHASDASAIVISDYLKGCITARVMRAAVEAALANVSRFLAGQAPERIVDPREYARPGAGEPRVARRT